MVEIDNEKSFKGFGVVATLTMFVGIGVLWFHLVLDWSEIDIIWYAKLPIAIIGIAILMLILKKNMVEKSTREESRGR